MTNLLMARCAGLVCLAGAAFFLINFVALDALLEPLLMAGGRARQLSNNE